MDEKYLVVSNEPLIELRHMFFPVLDEKYIDRTIVMIIGWLDYIENRVDLIESFRNIANIIIYEPRGFGKSYVPEIKGLFSLEDFTYDFAKIIDFYQIKERDYYIWASSFGCSIALNYSIEEIGPQPKAFFLGSPEAKTQSRWWFHIVKHFPKFLYSITMRFVLFFLKPSIKRINPKDAQGISSTFQEFKGKGIYQKIRILFECLDKFDIRGREHEISSPMLAFIAKKDWYSNPENTKKLAAFNPKSKVICIGESHRTIVDNRSELTKHINEYIEELEDR
jgi:pimeloyl-ACP methyl ester carboxylesterase